MLAFVRASQTRAVNPGPLITVVLCKHPIVIFIFLCNCVWAENICRTVAAPYIAIMQLWIAANQLSACPIYPHLCIGMRFFIHVNYAPFLSHLATVVHCGFSKHAPFVVQFTRICTQIYMFLCLLHSYDNTGNMEPPFVWKCWRQNKGWQCATH